MCGIFGIVASGGATAGSSLARKLLVGLAHASERRGSEASGLAVSDAAGLRYMRSAGSIRNTLGGREATALLDEALTGRVGDGGVAIIGHSRLVTNGTQGLPENNQPVASEGFVGVHNGIIVNESELWQRHAPIPRTSKVDTEVFFRLADRFVAGGMDPTDAVSQVYGLIVGEANIACLSTRRRSLWLATNVGSLYWVLLQEQGLLLFASEEYFLREVLVSSGHSPDAQRGPVKVPVGRGIEVSIATLATADFELGAPPLRQALPVAAPAVITDVNPPRGELRRCTRCILPHTFPFITFDADGVCSYCHEDDPRLHRSEGPYALEAILAKHRGDGRKGDCIVALSGGRDSCYGLHVLKREFGMTPVAYTYDWAMVTDEARRNCSRVCEKLGVEHIIRSADIVAKRRNIRLNINAWLKRPELGMIPLFMAGDKQFFHYASEVSAQTGIGLVIFCGGNNLEVTRFKTGFCGVKDRSHNTMVGLDNVGKAKLLAYYGRNFLLNPAYLNRSLFDTFFAFYSTYLRRGEFLYLYRYLEWDEARIAATLSEHYGWESAGDSASTWRIGDGTASFYNFIYHTVAGFSEHDTFRSNQIRRGLLTRERALELVREENKPRMESMREYAQLVGFSLDEALVRINRIPKLG